MTLAMMCFRAMSSGSAGNSAVDLQFRLYQQKDSGNLDQSLRRVALTGSALDKVPSSNGSHTDRACVSAALHPVNLNWNRSCLG